MVASKWKFDVPIRHQLQISEDRKYEFERTPSTVARNRVWANQFCGYSSIFPSDHHLEPNVPDFFIGPWFNEHFRNETLSFFCPMVLDFQQIDIHWH